jgi:hypothetical protein
LIKSTELKLSSKTLNLKRRSFYVERKKSYADYKICGQAAEKNVRQKSLFHKKKILIRPDIFRECNQYYQNYHK